MDYAVKLSVWMMEHGWRSHRYLRSYEGDSGTPTLVINLLIYYIDWFPNY